MATTHIVLQVLRLKAGESVFAARQTMKVEAVTLHTMQIATLGSSLVTGGEESMIGCLVLPDHHTLLYRDHSMNAFEVSLRKSIYHAAKHNDEAEAQIALEVVQRMSDFSLKFEDVTDKFVLDVFAQAQM